MQNLPRLFGDHAEFIEPPDTSMLDAPTLGRLAGVRTAYNNLKNAEAAEKVAKDFIGTRLEAVQAAEDYRNRYFPPDTFRDNWMASFGSPEQQAEYAKQKLKSAASRP